MSNKIWVLTYTIGTNEGRKSRRLICDTKELAIMQQTVLGGDLVEYLRKPEAFKVNWPEGMDINGALASLRELQNNPKTWSDFQCLRAEPEVKDDPFTNIRAQHAEWSDRQFGNVGPVGRSSTWRKRRSRPPKRRMTLASSPISSCWYGTQRAAPDSAMSSWLKRWRKSWNGTSAGRGARSKMANLATT